MDVGHDATAGDGDGAKKAGELLVVADGELDVARHDAGLLVVPRGVSGKLKNLRGSRGRIQQLSNILGDTSKTGTSNNPRPR